MDRAEWLTQMRALSESLYDRIAPEYWITFGFYENAAHLECLHKFLALVPAPGTLLSAACGAGRYDGLLLDAGHTVLGIDQSSGMLSRARERFPAARYERLGLQEMDFHESFDGAICMDAMEHIPPEDWPGIMQGFHDALKPGGLLYFTVEMPEPDTLQSSYDRARAMGLPVVFGELADEVQASYEHVKSLPSPITPADLDGEVVYHYYPGPDQVHAWLTQSGLILDEQGTGSGYYHFLARRPS